MGAPSKQRIIAPHYKKGRLHFSTIQDGENCGEWDFNVANSQRNDLIQEIDELVNHLVTTGAPQRLYKQGATKLYGAEGPGFSRLDAAKVAATPPVAESDVARDSEATDAKEE